MFGKRSSAQKEFDPSEFRVHDRMVVRDMAVYVDGQKVEVLDYSDGGVRVRSKYPLPRSTVIEVFKSGQLLRETVAVTAWTRGDQTGYAFRSKLKVTRVEGAAPRERKEAIDADRNDTGGVAGSALRNRLKL